MAHVRWSRRWPVVLVSVFALSRLRAARTSPTAGRRPGRRSSPQDHDGRPSRTAGEITIGVKFDVPPFGFKNPQTDAVEGFDVDLGQAIADELGVEPNFIEAISDNRIPFLVDGTADLILSTMTITRTGTRRSTSPTRTTSLRAGCSCPRTPTSPAWRIWPARPCARRPARRTRRTSPRTGARCRAASSSTPTRSASSSIQTDAVDAVSTDDVILTGMIIQDDTLKLVGDGYTTEPYGAGIAEGRQGVQGVRRRRHLRLHVGRPLGDRTRSGSGSTRASRRILPTMTLEEALELRPARRPADRAIASR